VAPQVVPPAAPAVTDAQLLDALDPPLRRDTALAIVEQDCHLPTDPDHPDAALGKPVADWGQVTRRERVPAQLAGRELTLTMYEVAGHRGTYRFKDEAPGGRLVAQVGDLLVLCVTDDQPIYTLPAAWSGMVRVSAAPVSAPPRITEVASLAPLHVSDRAFVAAVPGHPPRLPAGRRYLVHAKVGAADGTRFAMGGWVLDVPEGVPGIATGRAPWLVVEEPTWEDAPEGGKPHLVLRAVAAIDSMFP